jgi:hypothetical protein
LPRFTGGAPAPARASAILRRWNEAVFETPESETAVQAKESSRSYKVINEFLEILMLALSIALMVGITALALSALVSFLGG